jgi:hypothetical protein
MFIDLCHARRASTNPGLHKTWVRRKSHKLELLYLQNLTHRRMSTQLCSTGLTHIVTRSMHLGCIKECNWFCIKAFIHKVKLSNQLSKHSMVDMIKQLAKWNSIFHNTSPYPEE